MGDSSLESQVEPTDRTVKKKMKFSIIISILLISAVHGYGYSGRTDMVPKKCESSLRRYMSGVLIVRRFYRHHGRIPEEMMRRAKMRGNDFLICMRRHLAPPHGG